MNGPQHLLDRLLGMAVALLVIAALLHWAGALLRPLVPVLVAVAVLLGLVRWLVRRRGEW